MNLNLEMELKMWDMTYVVATENDLPFIIETYNENIGALHGACRSYDTWKNLLLDKQSKYYVVYRQTAVAWFRIDLADDEFWLGMLQIKPVYHRQGIGKYILSVIEEMARKEGFQKVGIHTTEDNIAARNLYTSAGYCVTEIGPCTTADSRERVGYTFQKEI